MPKKILIFSTAYLPLVGGAEIAIKEITDRIDDIEFDMITLRFNGNLPKFEKVGKINVYRLGFTKNNPSPADLLKWPLKLNKIFFPFLACAKACCLHRKNKYSGIWAMMAAFAGFAAMFFKTCHKNVPYLLTLQEGDPIPEIKRKVRFVFPLFQGIFIKADFIQVISNYLAGFAREMGYKGELEVVPNGVDVEKFKGRYSDEEKNGLKNKLDIMAGEKIIITASRLVKKNAVDDAIKSLEYLPANVKFLILGDGPDENSLKLLAKNLKLDNRVLFLGNIEHKDLPKYLSITDIFVRPSLSEGLGISFLEAMAAGLPVIATPVGGIVDFLHDGQTGLFCEAHNPQNLALKAKIYLENKELTKKIIANAENLAEKDYGWNSIAVKMRNIFNNLAVKN
ncbi:MAG: glycosyltransferase family 4 protein [Patescibacteria group bacterium]|nr:glycosyltransferase family 4 protein [Patescibacteria group bacterium]